MVLPSRCTPRLKSCNVLNDRYDDPGDMCDLAILFIHLIVAVSRLLHPGGTGAVVAESLLVKQRRPKHLSLTDYRWRSHCRGLFQLPVTA
jgi:hypothetical protein